MAADGRVLRLPRVTWCSRLPWLENSSRRVYIQIYSKPDLENVVQYKNLQKVCSCV